MNRSSLFWFTAALGVLIGLFLYYQYVEKTEHFTDPPVPPAKGDDCPAGDFTEDTAVIPYQEKLKVYLSSFSTSVVGKKHKPYCASRQRWYDLKDPSVYFQVITTTPPADILDKGMPMKGVILKGPPSEFLRGADESYELKPFTLFFYASMKTPDFTDKSEVMLFRIYAETPNSMRLVLRSSEVPNNTRVDLIIGDYQHRYVWNITTTALVSNGNPTLYALTVDTTPDSKERAATLYIGRSMYTADVKLSEPVKLGNTPMEINGLANLDATLYSFGLIDHVLTDTEVQRLGDYMYRQQTGVDRQVSEAAQKAQSEADAKITDLKEQLSESKTTCPTEPPKDEPKGDKWHIKVPGSEGAVARDTDVCPGLKIKGAVPPSADAPAAATAPDGAPETKSSYHVSYPADVVETMKDMAETDAVMVNTTKPVEKDYKIYNPLAPLPESSDMSKVLFQTLVDMKSNWM